MREMKDSGVEWLGAIPSGWEILRGKNVLVNLKKPVLETDEIITCFRDGEVTLRSNRREDGFTLADKEIGYQGIDIGDLVIHGMDGFAGAIGISDSRGKASPVLIVCDSAHNKKFITYYLRSMAHSDVFLATATGIRVRSCDLRWNKLAVLEIPIPSIHEQHKIASYLDQKIAIIDNIIEKTKQSIEVYKKYKKSLITETVTKGLNPYVKMKDSGIEWIGEIPEHWELQRAKYIFSESADKGNKELVLLSATQDRGVVPKDTLDSVVHVKEETDLSKFKTVHKNDFVISLRSFEGGFELSKYEGVITPAYTVFRSTTIINTHYYWRLFKSVDFITKINSLITGIREGKNIKFFDFSNIQVPFPPLEEQDKIVKFISEKANSIDKLIQVKESLLNELEAYKKSLIYEVVTGKKEII